MHEALHAMCDGLPEDLPLTEGQVSILGERLTAFLIDNGILEVDPLDLSEDANRTIAIRKYESDYADDFRHS